MTICVVLVTHEVHARIRKPRWKEHVASDEDVLVEHEKKRFRKAEHVVSVNDVLRNHKDQGCVRELRKEKHGESVEVALVTSAEHGRIRKL